MTEENEKENDISVIIISVFPQKFKLMNVFTSMNPIFPLSWLIPPPTPNVAFQYPSI